LPITHTDGEEQSLLRQDTIPPTEREEAVTLWQGKKSVFIIVEIKDVRISDYKGMVRDWAIVPEGQMVNGA
jgi:hypothetical protein